MNQLKITYEPVNNIYYKENCIYDESYYEEFIYTINPNIIKYELYDDSMQPEFYNGQILIIDKQNLNLNSKNIYLVMTPEGNLIRRIKYRYPRIILFSSNPLCNKLSYNCNDINIIGRVIGYE